MFNQLRGVHPAVEIKQRIGAVVFGAVGRAAAHVACRRVQGRHGHVKRDRVTIPYHDIIRTRVNQPFHHGIDISNHQVAPLGIQRGTGRRLFPTTDTRDAFHIHKNNDAHCVSPGRGYTKYGPASFPAVWAGLPAHAHTLYRTVHLPRTCLKGFQAVIPAGIVHPASLSGHISMLHHTWR